MQGLPPRLPGSSVIVFIAAFQLNDSEVIASHNLIRKILKEIE
jgi:hypothetical protein